MPEDPSPRPECSAEHHDARCSAEHLPAVARTHADALVALVHAAAAAGEPGDGVGAEISVHVDDATMRTGAGDLCELDDGPGLPAETARRLACDAAVVEIGEDAGGVPRAAVRPSSGTSSSSARSTTG